MATTKTPASKNSIISPDEVVKSRRGRRAVTNDELLKFLGSIEPGKVGIVGQFGAAVDPEMRNKVGSEIRKHWKLVHDTKPQIDWNPQSNLPQVGHKASK